MAEENKDWFDRLFERVLGPPKPQEAPYQSREIVGIEQSPKATDKWIFSTISVDVSPDNQEQIKKALKRLGGELRWFNTIKNDLQIKNATTRPIPTINRKAEGFFINTSPFEFLEKRELIYERMYGIYKDFFRVISPQPPFKTPWGVGGNHNCIVLHPVEEVVGKGLKATYITQYDIIKSPSGYTTGSLKWLSSAHSQPDLNKQDFINTFQRGFWVGLNGEAKKENYFIKQSLAFMEYSYKIVDRLALEEQNRKLALKLFGSTVKSDLVSHFANDKSHYSPVEGQFGFDLKKADGVLKKELTYFFGFNFDEHLKKKSDEKENLKNIKALKVGYGGYKGYGRLLVEEGAKLTEKERIELLHKASEGVGVPLKNESQLPDIEESLRRREIILLNVSLMAKETDNLKKIVLELKNFVKEIDGDIARIDNDKILLTPAKIKIVKEKKK